jgi:hypothetical protein
MNSDEIKSLVVKILLVVFSSLAAKYHISGDTVTAIASDVADLAVVSYGIYDHWNMKKVAETAKVVGAVLFAFLLIEGWGGLSAQAANTLPMPKPKPAFAALGPSAKQTLTAAQVQQNPLVLLQQFTAGDLTEALSLANAQTPPDTTAAACYTQLLTIVNGLNPSGSTTLPNDIGAFTALQAARDAQSMMANMQAANGPLAALNMACAPLVLSVQNTLIGLGIGAGVIVSGPAGAATTVFGALQVLLSGLKL